MNLESVNKFILDALPWMAIFLLITMSNHLWAAGDIILMLLSYIPIGVAIKILNHFYVMREENKLMRVFESLESKI